jgi:hypothetical protein
MIWVFVDVFGDVSFRRSFRSWLKKNQVFVGGSKSPMGDPKVIYQNFRFVAIATILLGWSI